MCLAFDVARLDAVARELQDVLEMQPPQGLVEKVQGLKKLEVDRRLRCRGRSRAARARRSCSRATTSTSICSRSSAAGRAIPPLHHAAGRDHEGPETGTRNVGMYRMQKIDKRSTFMHWQIHKDGAHRLPVAADGRLPVAVALGLDPVTAYAASAPLPKHIDEFLLAGFLRASRSSSSAARRSTWRCPAKAEIVLEGYVERGEPGSRARSATTPATTRPPSRSRSSR